MRLATGGQIDRRRTLELTFDGRPLTAHPGDTLASALMANGVRLTGRSFKYRRPRGTLTAGSEEPNALVTIGGNPNLRATTQEAHDGLVAFSQNRWPSLAWDAMGLNDLLAPLIGAGFYYKTFMWPKPFWERLYEPLIRRAAGLGRLAPDADTDRHEKAFAFCDLLVIGAGPAGLMTALTAGRAGARVILADEDFRPGGRLNAERMDIGGQPAAAWAAATAAELAALPNVRLMPRTTVTGAYDGSTYGALERVSEHTALAPEATPRTCFWRIAAARAILAAGALERPIAFRDNDRPGIMLRRRRARLPQPLGRGPGPSVAVFATNDDGPRTAADLAAAGIEVTALIDPTPGASLPEGPWWRFPGGHGRSTPAAGSGSRPSRSATPPAPAGSRPTALPSPAAGTRPST